MKISKYGVTLKRLTEDKIEMVRQWRNDPKIAQYMEYRVYITPVMQAAWFKSINNKHNFYFIIEFKGKEIGIINIKNIDYELMEGEGGIYIYDNDYINSDVPFRATLCKIDFCFEDIQLNRITAHVMRDNKRAIKYNQLLGFKLIPDQEHITNQLYVLSKEDYYHSREYVAKLL
ncbi:MAG: GNAT family N-acetyltransferase [Bacteroidetes bacterium]|nr:GNAT family N-acetyltransferase [Bacteroidota bacterium]